jgi:hypothetical protein
VFQNELKATKKELSDRLDGIEEQLSEVDPRNLVPRKIVADSEGHVDFRPGREDLWDNEVTMNLDDLLELIIKKLDIKLTPFKPED